MSRALVSGGLVAVAVIAGTAVGGALGLGLAFVVASAARMVDGRTWFGAADRDAGGAAVVGGAVVGVLALVGALLVSAPLGDALARGVEWSTAPVVRGSVTQAATIAVLMLAIGVAAELTFRRWLLEWVADRLAAAGLGRGAAVAGGVAAAALAEALIAPLDGDRAGIFVTSAALGVIYLAAGRRVGASGSARVTFEIGAVVLQALRLVG